MRDPEPPRVRSRERTPVRQSRSETPQQEVQPALPAIEDGTPPRGNRGKNFQEKERELHLGSILVKEGEGDDLRQHLEIVLQKRDNVLRLQLRIGLIAVRKGLRHQKETILLKKDNVLRLHLRSVLIVVKGVHQHLHMIACLRRENHLHLPQENLHGREGEEGVLQNPV